MLEEVTKDWDEVKTAEEWIFDRDTFRYRFKEETEWNCAEKSEENTATPNFGGQQKQRENEEKR